jgi:hypothetical protein
MSFYDPADISCEATEPVPLGPGPCPNYVDGCPNLENGNTPTGECLDCVDRAYAAQELAEEAERKATFDRWLDKHTLDDTDLNDPPAPEEQP